MISTGIEANATTTIGITIRSNRKLGTLKEISIG